MNISSVLLKKKINIFSNNLIYIFNISIPTLIFFILVLKEYYKISVDFSLVIALNFFLLYSISGNYRQTLISDNDSGKCKEIISTRILISPLIFVISSIISFFFLKINNLELIFIASASVIIVWIVELLLCLDEIEKKINSKLFHLVLYGAFTFILLILSFIINIEFFLRIFLILLIFYLFLNLSKKKVSLKIKYNENFKFIIGINYVSSIFLNFSAFIFRYEINFFYSKEVSSFLIFAFTIGSMISTIALNSFGPKDFIRKQNFSFSSYLLSFFYFIFFIILYVLISMDVIFAGYDQYTKNSLFISVVGGFIFFKSYIYRQNLLSYKKSRHFAFYLDIFFSLILIVSVPVLYYLNSDLIIFNYLIISVISFLIYFYAKKSR